MTLMTTLGNTEWLKKHENEVKELLPKTWTHIENISALKLGFKLKLLGIDWRSEDEFGKVMVFLEKIGFMLRDGYKVRVNNKSVFNTSTIQKQRKSNG